MRLKIFYSLDISSCYKAAQFIKRLNKIIVVPLLVSFDIEVIGYLDRFIL